LSRNNTRNNLLKLSETPHFGKKGRKTKGYSSSEQLDKHTYNNELLELWNNSGRGKIEEVKYTNSDGVELKQKVCSYSPEQLSSKLSWICAKCVCHDRCPGYYYQVNSGIDGFDSSLSKYSIKELKNPDVFDSLKRKCLCKSCKHNLDLGLN